MRFGKASAQRTAVSLTSMSTTWDCVFACLLACLSLPLAACVRSLYIHLRTDCQPKDQAEAMSLE